MICIVRIAEKKIKNLWNIGVLYQFSGGVRGASDSESESEESEVEVDFEDDLEYLRSLDPKETQDQDHYKVSFYFKQDLLT